VGQGLGVEHIAHRVPMSNGTQAGADELARFYTETSAESAVRWLQKSGARYVMVDPTMSLLGDPNRAFLPSALESLDKIRKTTFAS